MILTFFTSVFVAFFTTPFVIKFAKTIGIVDDPKKNPHPKVIHTYPIPRGGVISIFLAVFVASLIFLPFDKHLIGILLASFLISLLGVIDDKYNLNPYFRLVAQFLCAGIVVGSGIGIAFINNPITHSIIDLSKYQITFNLLGPHSIWVLSDIFAILWIVLLMNILNMGAKGVDGQLPGVVAFAALFVGLISYSYSADITQWPVIILALIVSGAYFGFLPWNFYPQKIMPGFGGSNLAGLLLATLSILSTSKVGTLILVLGIPMIDTFLVITKRIVSGKSPVWGDRGHLHHKLLDLGLNKRMVALFYWFCTILLGIIAININATQKLYTIVGLVVITISLILLLGKFIYEKP